jgi:hypothetical protein
VSSSAVHCPKQIEKRCCAKLSGSLRRSGCVLLLVTASPVLTGRYSDLHAQRSSNALHVASACSSTPLRDTWSVLQGQKPLCTLRTIPTRWACRATSRLYFSTHIKLPGFERLAVQYDRLARPCTALSGAGTEAVQRAQAARKPLKLGELSELPLESGMASPSGPLQAPNSSASDDGRGCDDESGDPTYAPVPRKPSLSSGDSESAPEHAHCLSGSGSGFSDAVHQGARVRRAFWIARSLRNPPGSCLGLGTVQLATRSDVLLGPCRPSR